MTITVYIPTSDQATLIERAARLRQMAAVLNHDLTQIPPNREMTWAEMSACGRAERWELEAGALERAAGVKYEV